MTARVRLVGGVYQEDMRWVTFGRDPMPHGVSWDMPAIDRKKDMILSGGFNVFPRNIEEANPRAPKRVRCYSPRNT